MDETERSAHQYAEVGWPVFALAPGSKIPHKGTAGFEDASTDHREIQRVFRQHPGSNVAIATGAPGPTVLDVDVSHDRPGPESLNKALRAGVITPGGPLIRTPSGGQHWYFQGDQQPNAVLRKSGLDLRGLGGYVAAPPSQVDGRQYEVVRGGPLAARIDFGQVRNLLEPSSVRTPWEQREWSGELGDKARTGIARVVADSNSSGGWANALYWAGARYGERDASLTDALAELTDAAAPWNEYERHRAEMHIRNGWTAGREAIPGPKADREAGS